MLAPTGLFNILIAYICMSWAGLTPGAEGLGQNLLYLQDFTQVLWGWSGTYLRDTLGAYVLNINTASHKIHIIIRSQKFKTSKLEKCLYACGLHWTISPVPFQFFVSLFFFETCFSIVAFLTQVGLWAWDTSQTAQLTSICHPSQLKCFYILK